MHNGFSFNSPARVARHDTLEALRALKRRTADLASSQLEALDNFYLSRDHGSLRRLADGPVAVGGFTSVLPAPSDRCDGTTRASLASTAACVRSLLVCPPVKPGHADFTGLLKNVIERHENGQLSTYGLEHLNPFTIGQLLPVLREVVGSSPEPAVEALVADAVKRLQHELDNDGVAMPAKTDPDADEQRFTPHGYLTYGALRALAACGKHEGDFARPSLRWSEMELYRQIALFHSGHDERSDAYQLGYNLLIQYRFNRFRLGDSLIESGLRTLFSAQLERGVWEKRDPVFRYGNHGEAHCFSFELLSSLLREFRGEWSLLVPWEGHLSRAVEWAARNAIRRHAAPRCGVRPTSWRTPRPSRGPPPRCTRSCSSTRRTSRGASRRSCGRTSAASRPRSRTHGRSTGSTSRRSATATRSGSCSAICCGTGSWSRCAFPANRRRTRWSAAPTPAARPARASCSGRRARARRPMSARSPSTSDGRWWCWTRATSPRRVCR
ncbi:MAG: hypothetical protein ACRD1K_19280 [Acidimicrobiales bacterium]